jgi:hypothetical protein
MVETKISIQTIHSVPLLTARQNAHLARLDPGQMASFNRRR